MTEALLAILFIAVAFKVANSLNANNEEAAGREVEDEPETEEPTFVTKMGLDHNCEID